MNRLVDNTKLRGWRGGVLATLAATILGTTAFGGIASAAVVWDVRSEAHTSVAPGDTLNYMLRLTNVGDTATSTDAVFEGTLPAGMTFVSATPVTAGWDCSATSVGDSVVRCTLAAPVDPVPLGPIHAPQMFVTVAVDPDPGVSAGLRTARFELSGGAPDAVPDVVNDPTFVMSDPLGFGVDGFDGQVLDVSGNAFTQAGGRPYDISTQIDLARHEDPLYGPFRPVEPLRTVVVDLPPGFIGDPTSVDQCTPGELANSANIIGKPLCPVGSQIGVVRLKASRGFVIDFANGPVSLYNMVPPPSVAARFGFNVLGSIVTLDARVRSGDDYGVTVEARYNPEALDIIGTELTIWGTPADPSHDPLRACPGELPPVEAGPICRSDEVPVPFLRNPTSCTAPSGDPVQDGLVTRLSVDSWTHPGRLLPNGRPDLSDPAWKTREFVSHDDPGYPANPADPSTPWGPHLLPTGCENVPFEPTLEGKPREAAAVSTPTAFTFDLTLPQESMSPIGTADLRKAVVTLPAGVRVSPSSAHGLEGCNSVQIGLRSGLDHSCPLASKIGTATIHTPLLADPLEGSIYLATPHDNPFNNLITIYLVARGPGVILKLPGRIDPDSTTGQLTATFDDNPQLPFETLHLEFKDGPRAPIVTPDLCGSYETNAVFTSWSGKTVTTRSTFDVSVDGKGGTCPATRAFSPRFHAGAEHPVAGGSSPFVVNVSRGDRDQQIGGLTVEMPPGLLGRIKNATLCSAGDASRGACGEASRIGSVTVGAGAGPNPFYITNGRAYITESHRGAPFGMSIVVPAVAGPFNLGDVNVQAAIEIDRETAELSVVSDPLPTILEGIPLDVRDIRVKVDKPNFIVNPTSCSPKTVRGRMQSTSGATAEGSTRFQVGKCGDLRLRPRMTLIVGKRGRTGRGASTPFRTIIEQTAGQSNLRYVGVTLPMTLNARLNVVNRACTLAEFKAANCEKARAGIAIAHTPLLAEPLRGGAYFVRNGRPLPDLMIALRGQVAIDLDGKVSIPGGKRLATRFETIPDAPITRFELRLVAGAKGPIGAARNLCTARSRQARAGVRIRGQNGDVLVTQLRLKVRGCAKRGGGSRRGARRR